MGHEVTLDLYSNTASSLTDADAMTVHGVSQNVCRRVAGNASDWNDLILFVNDVETDPEDSVASQDLCQEGDNDLTFAFETEEEIGRSEPADPAECFIRRKRLGHYRPESERASHYSKDLAALARAGFSYEVATQTLRDIPSDE